MFGRKFGNRLVVSELFLNFAPSNKKKRNYERDFGTDAGKWFE